MIGTVMSGRLHTWCGILAELLLRPIANLDLAAEGPGTPGSNGLIIVANHRSMMDILIGLAVFRRWEIAPRILVKACYFDQPVAGIVLRGIHAIPTSPAVAAEAMRVSIEALANGQCIALTPEGRVPRRAERPEGVSGLRTGAARLAVVLGTPIFVVGLSNTDKAWPLGSRLPIVRLRKASRPTVRIEAIRLAVEQGASVSAVMTDLRKVLQDAVIRAESPIR